MNFEETDTIDAILQEDNFEDAIEFAALDLKACSEEEIISWVKANMPFAIKPKITARTTYARTAVISAFKTYYGHEKVAEHLGKKLFEELNRP